MTFTPAVYSPTPNWQQTQTAMALTSIAMGWTPTPGATSTPDYNATMTALAWTPTPYDWTGGDDDEITATPSNSSIATQTASSSDTENSGNSGSGSTSSQNTATPSAWNGLGSAYAANCAAYVRALVYIDGNEDGIMALRDEGVDGVSVYLVNEDYNLIGSRTTQNGVAKFCVPSSAQGQTVYVHAPYLIRSGTINIPEANDSYSSWDVQQSIDTHEVIFKLDPPELPLYLP